MSRFVLTRVLVSRPRGRRPLHFGHPPRAGGRARALRQRAGRQDHSAPVDGLGADDVRVREDGRAREVLRVTPATSPMSVAILVDNQAATHAPSPTCARRCRRSCTSSTASARSRSSRSPTGRPSCSDYTTDAEKLQDAANRIFALPGSGATLLDAIVEVSQGPGQARGRSRGDGDRHRRELTEFSNRHYQDVLDELEKSGAMMNALVLNEPGGRRSERRGAQPRVGARPRRRETAAARAWTC